MKQFLLGLVLIFLGSAVAGGQEFYGTNDVKTFREGREKEFRDAEESPLTEKDFSDFNGLQYFDESKNFVAKAVYTPLKSKQMITFATSSGKPKKYVKTGYLNFKIGRKPLRLTVYGSDEETNKAFPEYADLLFVPFKDLTNGTETYGGGRYISLKISNPKSVELNFHLAYNPSCAYGSDRYSCPVPPKENSLPVRIEAGEKIYKKDIH